MNKLENIALKELKKSLNSSLARCADENADRMQHERIFLRRDINDALEIIKAIEQNEEQKSQTQD